MQSVPGRNVSARRGREEREREREREGIPETITSLNGLDLSPASSFFLPPSSLAALFTYTPFCSR